MIAKIDSYDKQKMTADVIPLLQDEDIDGDITDYGKLPKIPVSFFFCGKYYIRPAYEKDDLVWISFSSFDYSNAIKGEIAIKDDVKFSVSYAVVMHGILKDGDTAPDPFSKDGLLIGYDKSYIQIDENDINAKISGEYTIENDIGKLEMKSDGKINLNGSSDNVTAYTDMKLAFDQLKAEIQAHVHSGGILSGGLTGTPNAPLTADMSGAKVDNVRVS
jgi:hypothetical protein